MGKYHSRPMSATLPHDVDRGVRGDEMGAALPNF